jgi:glycosyltransferase involved in cell wall biosynthesis
MIVVINNHAETFDAAASGAIATHIWECWRAASTDMRPSVYTRLRAVRPYDVQPLVAMPTRDRQAEREFFMRARRRIARSLNWSTWLQREYARALRHRLKAAVDSGSPLIMLHNDPEIAFRVAKRHPEADVRHLFHNPLKMTPKTHADLRAASLRLFAVSDYVARWVENAAGLTEGSVETVYNGVDSTSFFPATSRVGEDIPRIGFLGRPGIDKAPDVFLEAVARMKRPRVHVLLAGVNYLTHHVADDYQRRLDDIGDRIETRGGRFTRVGRLTREQVPDFLRELDALVLPSRCEESCSLVLLEAMATGLPVIATRTGGSPELLGDSGLLVDRDDVDGLSQKLEGLLEDQARRAELSAAARSRAARFTWAATWAGLTSEAQV